MHMRTLCACCLPHLCAQVIENTLGRTNLRIAGFVAVVILTLHWSACVFYYVAFWDDFGPDTWVYHAFGDNLDDVNNVTRWVEA